MNFTRVAVTGSEGQLGGEICRQLGRRATGLTRSDCDLSRPEEISRVLRAAQPSAVINCAAYTAVDRAEEEPDLCRAVNTTAVGQLAKECRELDCPLVQISSDYVFGGSAARTTPYRESDPVGPQGVYAISKRDAEVQTAACPKHLIVRTCGLYCPPRGPAQNPNFVATILRLAEQRPYLKIVDDQRCTPSYVLHVAEAIVFLLDLGAKGTFHVVNSGSATWFEFAAEILRHAGKTTPIHPITTAQFGAPAPRPAYSVLDTAKYHRLGGPALPDWQEGLAAYFANESPCAAKKLARPSSG